jgi:gluconate 2-dehydrogenase gamma chain
VTADRLSAEHAAILAAVLARLIPSDEHGPGAREARVARYIERALAAEHREHCDAYSSGLSALQASARERHGAGFEQLDAAAQDALLETTERAAGSAAFFELVRTHAIEGMFGDPRWGGNDGLLGWALLDYPGPRREWTRREQQLDVAPQPGPWP